MADTLTQARPVTAEPQRWRNRWRALRWGRCKACRFSAGPGQEYLECCLPAFATREEAERDAIDDVMFQIGRFGHLCDEWLGAERCD